MKVCAVVVTFNRKQLLEECLNALLTQTKKLDAIYIIDNASTDGTEEMLAEKFLKKDVFKYVKMSKNIGGAGGFHEGMKRAYEDGYDWIWVMDDDGLTIKDTLEKLMDNISSSCLVLNSLVINKDDHRKISFGYNYGYNIKSRNLGKIYYSVDVLNDEICDDVMNGLAQLFNSTLINRLVIQKVGFPIKWFFIRGDEVEYVLRIQSMGYNTYTVKSSKIYHPSPTFSHIKIMSREFEIEMLNSMKLYNTIKNYMYIYLTYWKPIEGVKKIFEMIIKNIVGVFLNNTSLKDKLWDLLNIVKGVVNGVLFKIIFKDIHKHGGFENKKT